MRKNKTLLLKEAEKDDADEDEESKEALRRMKSVAGEYLTVAGIDDEEKRHGRALLTAGANWGDWYGLFRLGVFHESGEHGFERDDQISKELFEKSAVAGYPEALLMLDPVNKNELKNGDEKAWNLFWFRLKNNAFFGTCDLDSLFTSLSNDKSMK